MSSSKTATAEIEFSMQVLSIYHNDYKDESAAQLVIETENEAILPLKQTDEELSMQATSSGLHDYKDKLGETPQEKNDAVQFKQTESSSKLEVSRKHPCREPFHGHPHHVVPVKSAEEICSGDHILFQVTEPPFRAKFRSALVVQPSYCIEIIMNCEDGVVKTSIPFHQLTPLYKVIYQTPLYDGKTSIERAEFRLKLKEKCYHVLNNNSHFFVTWCTTGRESSLTDILRALESQPTSQEKQLKPIFYQTPIKTVTEQSLQPGDHIKFSSEHYLVESVNASTSTFTAYTIGADDTITIFQAMEAKDGMVRIECELYKYSIAQSLQRVVEFKEDEEQVSKWKTSDHFVTAMKCGVEYSLRESKSFTLEKKITSELVPLTMNLNISEGDHLVIRDYRKQDSAHSVLVMSCPDHTMAIINPKLASSDIIDLTVQPEVYRVNYSDSLPTSEVLLRGRSKQGEEILKNNPASHDKFVSWTKTGQFIPVKTPNVSIKRCFEKIDAYSQIEIGCHLLQHIEKPGEPVHQRHILVTEKLDQSKFKTVSCHRGLICEQVEEIMGEIYNIVYSRDDLVPVDETIEQVRKLVGQRIYNPWDRVLFIQHAKLKRYSMSHASFISVSKDQSSYSETEFKQQSSKVLPISKSRIMCFAQVSNGDYIIKVRNNAMSKKTSSSHSHYLVVSSGDSLTQCTVIGKTSHYGKIEELQCVIEHGMDPLDKHPFIYYRVNYESGKCFALEYSIKQAKGMIGQHTSINQDKLVHFLKTGVQVAVNVCKLSDERDHLEQTQLHSSSKLGQPLYTIPVTSCDQISKGAHILYRQGNAFPPSYCSAIVQEITNHEQGNAKFLVITNIIKSGITTSYSVTFSELKCLSRVVYLSSRFSDEEAISRAERLQQKSGENFFHIDYYNSHHFVTMCKTGEEYSLADIVVRKQILDHERDSDLDSNNVKMSPILFRVPIKALSEISSADHIMINKQHLLVESTNKREGTFSTYTVESTLCSKTNSVFLKQNQPWKEEYSQTMFRIEYSIQEGNLDEPLQALVRAKQECHNGTRWKSSEEFVTKMKCDKAYFFDDRCIMSYDVDIESYTNIDPCITVEEGDHLVLFDSLTYKHRSVLVCKCNGQSTVEVIPSLNFYESENEESLNHDLVDLNSCVAYRVNYSQCLPPEDVLQRAKSTIGKIMLLKKNRLNPDHFVSWAKTGRECSISDSESEIKQKLKIADRRPQRYEKIMSPEEIKVGDHLFTKNESIHEIFYTSTHYFVTEKIANVVDPIFKVIHFVFGTTKEKEHKFNFETEDGSCPVYYRVIYPEGFSCDLAVKRARSLVGKKLQLAFGSTVVRWIKTGSEEGLEVQFLINNSAPTSKSQIACFTQLNPGDYLLVQDPQSESLIGSVKKAIVFDHHYIVVTVESPQKCTVIESWRRKVEKKPIAWSEKLSYFRINYDPGQCILAEESIKIAENALSNSKFVSRYWKPNSDYGRKSFVHFIKTGEKSINFEVLEDDRLFLQRELVTSALDLRVGDHIERPLSLAPDHAQHHMLVVDTLDHSACKVIHFRVEKSISRVLQFKKGDVVCENVDIFLTGDAFRVVYPERTDPRNGMDKLIGIVEGGKSRLQREMGNLEYHLKDNNCEHLVMLATIGIPLSIQVNQVIHHALVFARGSLRSFRGSVIHHGAECAPKETTAHFMGHACGQAAKTKQATSGVMQTGLKSATSASSLALAGGIAFAINLAVETPVFIRSVYKLKKKANFDVISEEEFKRSVIKETLVSAFIVAGGTAGTVGGQATIPVPILGAMVGGLLGSLIGQGSGYVAGELLSRLIKEKKITLSKMLSYKYKKLLEY